MKQVLHILPLHSFCTLMMYTKTVIIAMFLLLLFLILVLHASLKLLILHSMTPESDYVNFMVTFFTVL